MLQDEQERFIFDFSIFLSDRLLLDTLVSGDFWLRLRQRFSAQSNSSANVWLQKSHLVRFVADS